MSDSRPEEDGKVKPPARRGEYIKGEKSDWLVVEIVKKKELLLFSNSKNLANGVKQQAAAWAELAERFYKQFPSNEKKDPSQMKSHFETRRDKIKDLLMKQLSYAGATGGGRDTKLEETFNKILHPTQSDAVLIDLIKKTKGALGVGSRGLETGHETSLPVLSDSDEEDSSEDEATKATAPKAPLQVDGVVSRRKNKKKKKLSSRALEAAKSASFVSFLKSTEGERKKRAVDLGLRAAALDEAPTKRARSCQEDALVDRQMKAAEAMTGAFQSFSKMAASQATLNTQLQVMSMRGAAAERCMAKIKSKLKDGDDVSQEFLIRLVADYDSSVSTASGGDGSADAPISLT